MKKRSTEYSLKLQTSWEAEDDYDVYFSCDEGMTIR